MYLWLLVWLATWAQAHSHWEPCKIQCDSNFKRNDMAQASLITVCKRGCDLFTVALISTSHPSTQPPLAKDHSEEPRTPSKKPATAPSSKTTVEPTAQPVQDHPVRETTTTHGPKKLPYKVPIKKLPAAVVVLQKDESNETHLKGRLEQAKHSCRHACVAAYGGAVEQEACVVGCHLQATTASLNPQQEEKEQSQDPQGPIGIFQHVAFSMASHVGRLVRITWSWASSSSHNQIESPENKVQIYGSEDMTRRAQVPLFIGLRQSYNIAEPEKGSEAEKETPSLHEELSNLDAAGLFHLPRPLDDHTPLSRPSEIMKIIKEETKEQGLERKEVGNDVQPQLDLLECISRKSGLPRWLIAVAIFASALVVLWLCFSLTAPPDDIKVVKTKPPESDCLFEDDDDDLDDDVISCSEKKKLLARNDDVIKIRIENV